MNETTYDRTTALLVVDVQNDFADPDGNLYVPGGEEVVEVANRERERAADADARVAYTQDWHPPVTPHFETGGGMWPVHCVRETWGAQLHPDLHVDGMVVRKGTNGEDGYSGFTMRDPESGVESSTGLEERLRDEGVERLVVVGLAGDVCVKASVLDARRQGFDVTVLGDGIRDVEQSPGDGARAREEMRASGATIV